MHDSIFETERLYVRRYQDTEADTQNFFILNSDQEVMKYIRLLKTPEESRHFLLDNIEAYNKSPMTGRWSVHAKTDHRFVGTFAIIPLQDTSYWQVGYALLKHEWGKGYASELTQTGIQYGFRRMMVSKLAAVTEISNKGSMHVLLKAGFTQKDNFVEDGKELCLFEINNKAVVETERLLIAALDNHQLDLYIGPDNRLENELGLKASDRVLSDDVRGMIDELTLPAMRLATENNYYFITIWVVIDKTQNRLVAELGFKGLPNARGEVEIGYGTFPAFQKKGYMTEAVSGMLKWVGEFAGVKVVTAQTDANNPASMRVLEKNGFQEVSRNGEMVVWAVARTSESGHR